MSKWEGLKLFLKQAEEIQAPGLQQDKRESKQEDKLSMMPTFCYIIIIFFLRLILPTKPELSSNAFNSEQI